VITTDLLWAACAAGAYGISDFAGGLGSRRASFWTVGLAAQFISLITTGLIATSLAGTPRATDLGWGCLAGVGNSIGTIMLYRGLATDSAAIAAVTSGLASMTLPVGADVLLGARLSALTWVGIAIAMLAVWLVSRPPVRSRSRTALRLGLGSGAGFALMFFALSRLGPGTGGLPLLANQVIALLVTAVGTVLAGARWHRTAGWGIAAGVLGAVATLAFAFASRGEHLSIATATTSLYPSVTVLCVIVVLRERISRRQAIGLGVSAIAVLVIAASQ
jgi:drug/metabolite transporter (DMT)-like permease